MPDKWFEFNLASPEVATIRVYGEIGAFDITAADFLAELDSVTAPTIRVHLNSPGGSVDDGLAIMNGLISHPATVETHVDAAAYSIASVIAQGADKGKRYMAPHSRMLVHNAMALGMGYASDFEQIAKHLRETSNTIAEIYAENSGKDVAYWLDKMDAETRFTDQQAVDEGLADQVSRATNKEAFKVAANFDWAKFKYLNSADLKAELEAIADSGDADLKAENERLLGEIARLEAELEAAKQSGGQPTNRADARRREVDRILAGIR